MAKAKNKSTPPAPGSSAPAPGNLETPAPTPGGVMGAPVQEVAFSRVKPAPYNPRRDLKPGDPEWEKLEREMREFGFLGGLVWNQATGHLVSGHQRLKVLRAHGWTSAPMAVVSLSLAKEKALNIGLNKIGGDWDNQKLAELLNESEMDVALAGFDAAEVQSLMDGLSEFGAGLDSEPPPPEVSGARASGGTSGGGGKRIGEAFAVTVECRNEAEQKRVYDRMTAAGHRCRLMML